MPLAIVVDDDPQICTLMSTIAGVMGYSTEEFNDSGSALARIRDAGKPRPDLLISDNDMPEVAGGTVQTDAGVRLIGAVRADEQAAAQTASPLQPMAIVQISGYDVSPGGINLAKNATTHSAQFRIKPFTPGVIMQDIRNANALVNRSMGSGGPGIGPP